MVVVGVPYHQLDIQLCRAGVFVAELGKAVATAVDVGWSAGAVVMTVGLPAEIRDLLYAAISFRN